MVGWRARRYAPSQSGSFRHSPDDRASVSVLHSDVLPIGASSKTYSEFIQNSSPLGLIGGTGQDGQRGGGIEWLSSRSTRIRTIRVSSVGACARTTTRPS